MKAFINRPDGYTDAELVSHRIGGTDGGRRRRECREKLGIDFDTKQENGATRWRLHDFDHARRVLNAGMPVEKEL